MKILAVHNYYRASGGEDAVFEAETRLLQEKGNQVVRYAVDNKTIEAISHAALASGTIWSWRTFRAIQQVIRHEQPDVAHFHNTFPLISPAAHHACVDLGVAVVQTLHNYRLFCAAGTFFRDGHVCESCLNRLIPWPGLLHACYRRSYAATAVASTMMVAHRLIQTWQAKVTLYVALCDFARQKFIEGGLLAERIVVKPNFVHPDPGLKEGNGEYALYVGRLTREKGLGTLLAAWRQLPSKIPLRIAGDGPMRLEIESEIRTNRLNHVQLLGFVGQRDVRALMKGARFLVFPSLWFETFGLTIAEAFACGLPVLTSRLGSMNEIVRGGVTGIHFEPGNAEDLASKAEWAWDHLEETVGMGRAARVEYETKYTADQNYGRLIQIYQKARAAQRGLTETPIAIAGRG